MLCGSLLLLCCFVFLAVTLDSTHVAASEIKDKPVSLSPPKSYFISALASPGALSALQLFDDSNSVKSEETSGFWGQVGEMKENDNPETVIEAKARRNIGLKLFYSESTGIIYLETRGKVDQRRFKADEVHVKAQEEQIAHLEYNYYGAYEDYGDHGAYEEDVPTQSQHDLPLVPSNELPSSGRVYINRVRIMTKDVQKQDISLSELAEKKLSFCIEADEDLFFAIDHVLNQVKVLKNTVINEDSRGRYEHYFVLALVPLIGRDLLQQNAASTEIYTLQPSDTAKMCKVSVDAHTGELEYCGFIQTFFLLQGKQKTSAEPRSSFSKHDARLYNHRETKVNVHFQSEQLTQSPRLDRGYSATAGLSGELKLRKEIIYGSQHSNNDATKHGSTLHSFLWKMTTIVSGVVLFSMLLLFALKTSRSSGSYWNIRRKRSHLKLSTQEDHVFNLRKENSTSCFSPMSQSPLQPVGSVSPRSLQDFTIPGSHIKLLSMKKPGTGSTTSSPSSTGSLAKSPKHKQVKFAIEEARNIKLSMSKLRDVISNSKPRRKTMRRAESAHKKGEQLISRKSTATGTALLMARESEMVSSDSDVEAMITQNKRGLLRYESMDLLV